MRVVRDGREVASVAHHVPPVLLFVAGVDLGVLPNPHAYICRYSESPLLRTPLLWTATYYGQQQNPQSVTFFNSVIKTPLLRTLLMDIRLLRTLFLVPIEEKSLYYGHQVRISLYFREKTSFSDKVARLFCHDE